MIFLVLIAFVCGAAFGLAAGYVWSSRDVLRAPANVIDLTEARLVRKRRIARTELHRSIGARR